MRNSVKTMGKIIRKERKCRKITIAALAEKANVTVQTIVALEKGIRNDIAVLTLLGIMDALDLSADHLIGTEHSNGIWDTRISKLSDHSQGAIIALYDYLQNSEDELK